MFRLEHNVETGEVLEIEMTPEEIAEREKEMAETAAKVAEENAVIAAKAHERAALLERLGIREEEAALLLGGN